MDELATLTLKEVARLLRISIKSARTMASSGKLPAFRVGGVWRIRRAALDQWMIEQEKRQDGSKNSL